LNHGNGGICAEQDYLGLPRDYRLDTGRIPTFISGAV
jgi:hypothetical protein